MRKFIAYNLPSNFPTLNEILKLILNRIELTVWTESVALFHYCEDREVMTSIEIWLTDNCFCGGVGGTCY